MSKDGANSKSAMRARGTKGRIPLDELPEFATDAEIGRALMGERAQGWKSIIPLIERQGLPKVDAFFGGRYTPVVRVWLDKRAGLLGCPAPGVDGPEDWSRREQQNKRLFKRAGA